MTPEVGLWDYVSTAAWLGAALGMLVLDLAVLWRLLGGPGVGPKGRHVATLFPAKQAATMPASPGQMPWYPWFWYPGLHFLELKYGLVPPPGTWSGYVHELGAHAHYLNDRMPEAVRAAEHALASGLRPGSAAERIRAMAIAEGAAYEHPRLVTHGAFELSLPPDTSGYDGLPKVLDDRCRELRELLGYAPKRTVIGIPPVAIVDAAAGGALGYFALKRHGDCICIARPVPDDAAEAAVRLAEQLARLAVSTVAGARPPRWLVDGIVQRASGDPLGPEPLPPAESPIEAVFLRAVAPSPLGAIALAPSVSGAIVDELVARHGTGSIQVFAHLLARHSETAAFRRAFGVSMRRFAREWQGR